MAKEEEERGSSEAPRDGVEERQPNQPVNKEDNRERKLNTTEAKGEWQTSMRRPNSRRNRRRFPTINSVTEGRGAGPVAELRGPRAKGIYKEPSVEKGRKNPR